MSETEAYARALSSTSRVEILKLLYKKSFSVEEIAKELGLKPITIRHHLQYLSEAGLIEAFEKREGSVGRPKVYYKVTKTPQTFSFPKRYYLRLSRFLINGMELLAKKS
ncbi:MAG: ArsR family transcriptional regulator [Candidatus Bathyarchaeia archaeon]